MSHSASPISGTEFAKMRQLQFWAPWFVWTVWYVAFGAMLALAVSYTLNIPWGDEWDYAPVLAGERPITLSFFWEQHNEHRIPLPKLIWLLSLQLSHLDFRVLSFVHAFTLGVLAGLLIQHAKLLRGRTSYTDAFLPLLVMNSAQYQNLLWAWQIGFVLPLFLIGILLIMIVRSVTRGPSLTWKTVTVAAAVLLVLPVCGALGLVFAPALVLWWGGVGLAHWRSADRLVKRKITVLLSANFAVFVLLLFYLHGLHRPAQIPPTPRVWASLGTTLEFLTGSFGYNAGLAFPLVGWVVLLMILMSVGVVLRALLSQPEARLHAAGFLLFIGAGVALGFGIGWGRAGLGVGAGLQQRYVTLMIPLLAAMYFVWQIYVSAVASRVAQFLLLALITAVLPTSVRETLAFRQLRIHQMNAFNADLQKKLPLAVLVQRHVDFLDHFADSPQQGAEGIRLMKQAGLEFFRSVDTSRIDFQSEMISGALDRVDADRIDGWVWDRARPTSSLQVDILDGDKLLSTVDAIQFREDLLKSGIGQGRHSFTYLVPASLADGQPHTIRGLQLDGVLYALDSTVIDLSLALTIVKDAGIELPGSPRILQIARESKFLAAPVVATIDGALDVVDDHMIAGWAWDRSDTNKYVRVEIRDGDTVLATVDATQFRKDLLEAGLGRGDHAFVQAMPDRLKDGKSHQIHVVVVGANIELPGSPKTFVAKR